MTTLFDPGPCRWCLNSRDRHPVYTALEGVHDWEPDIGPDTAPTDGSTEARGCRCATDGRGEHACGPTPSDRLPPRTRQTETHQPVTMADLDEAAEQHAPADQATEETRQQIASHYGVDAERVQPAVVQHEGQYLPGYRIIGGRPDPAEAFQRELIRKRPLLGPALDQAARDLQKRDRPSLLRRIRNALKGTSC